MRILWLAAFTTVGFLAQTSAHAPPSEDARNTTIITTDTHFKMPEYRTLADWEARKAILRRQILYAAGLLPGPAKTPLHPQIFGRLARKDYSIEKVLLETLPGYYLGGNLYRPLGKSGKFPAVATPHGHWTYGRLENQPLGSIPARCINLARQGYVVFAYDMVGYNDTIQTPHGFGGPAEQLWSFGPLGLQLWNSIRVIDFLQSLDDVAADRIAMTGASGGGTQTFMLTAVDERVKWSAPVNMVSAIMQGGSPCENAPNLRLGTFNVEIAAMMAPRPMLMVAATGDWTRNTPREEYPAIRHIYELYGQPENVETIQFDAPHNYNRASREAVYRFFAKRVLAAPDADKYAEQSFQVEKLQDMLALHNRTLPANALTYDGLFQEWKDFAARWNASADPAVLREQLTYSLGAEWPAELASYGASGQLILSRQGKGDRIPAWWTPGTGAPVLLVDPLGADAARKNPAFEPLIKAHRPVLLIDAFQTGSAVAKRDRSHDYFLTFNQTDDANRVQDILTALRFLDQEKAGRVELIGTGKAAVWCLFAAAVAPVEVKLNAGLEGFSGTDEDFIKDFFVPGIQHAGGMEAALKLTATRR